MTKTIGPKGKRKLPKKHPYTNIRTAYDDFKRGQLSPEELSQLIIANKTNPKFWDVKHYKYLDGDETPREDGFTFSPYQTRRGRFFQTVTKKAILAAIDFAFQTFPKEYDPNIYTVDDDRLNKIEQTVKDYININFQNSKPYKEEFMLKVLAIIVGLCKEDIYYRARFLEMLNELQKAFPDGIQLTEAERRNIDKWH